MTSTPAHSVRAEPGGRLSSLDGLRGVAALVVLVHHALFVLPVMATVQAGGSARGESWLLWVMTHTPFHVIWAGEEAVLVFFVLSGLVLALPATRRPLSWRAYYPRRVVRLYLPVWAAVVVAVALYLAVPREAVPERSQWLNERTQIPVSDAWNGVVLLNGPTAFNTPLWSLQWEMIFSLLLPVFLLLGRIPRRLALGAGVALLGMVAVGTYAEVAALRFLPMFGFGVLMAFHADVLQGFAVRVDNGRRPRAAWVLLAVLTAVLLTARWVADGIAPDALILSALASGAALIGALLTVFVALHWPRGRTFLQCRPVRWLGLRSFSLYIVHEPVIVTVAFLIPLSVSPWWTIAVAVPLALLTAAVVFRLAEAPAHRLSRRLRERWGPRAQAPFAGAVAAPGRIA